MKKVYKKERFTRDKAIEFIDAVRDIVRLNGDVFSCSITRNGRDHHDCDFNFTVNEKSCGYLRNNYDGNKTLSYQPRKTKKGSTVVIKENNNHLLGINSFIDSYLTILVEEKRKK